MIIILYFSTVSLANWYAGVTLRDDLYFVRISEHVDRVRVIQEISETWRSSWI